MSATEPESRLIALDWEIGRGEEKMGSWHRGRCGIGLAGRMTGKERTPKSNWRKGG